MNLSTKEKYPLILWYGSFDTLKHHISHESNDFWLDNAYELCLYFLKKNIRNLDTSWQVSQ